MKNLGLLIIFSLNVLLVSAQNNIENNTDETNSTVDIENYINVSLFPNPNKGEFFIQMDDDRSYDVTIYAMNGMIIYSKKNIQDSQYRIELESSIAKGFYQVVLRQGTTGIVKKLIIN